MVVKVGGMCWVISTGTRSITDGRRHISPVSACGPPVDEPSSRTRGVTVENGRSLMAGWGGASGSTLARSALARSALPRPSTVNRASGSTGRRAGATSDGRRRRAPRVRIFSIRSRRNVAEVVTSRLVSGFGM